MQRRFFLAGLAGILTETQSYVGRGGAQEATKYLTPRRIHGLLASEVADGITVRMPGQSAPVIDFKLYDRAPEIFRSLALTAREASTGLYVRGTVPFSLRLLPSRDLVPEPLTSVVFAQRARVSVFTERDPAWPKNSGQIIIVAIPERWNQTDRD